DLARAPISLRLDPNAGPLFIARADVLVLGECAAALHQAEAFGRGDREGAGGQPSWIVKRPPEAFVIARVDGERLRVVDARAEVGRGRRLMRRVQEHAGQRRRSELAARGAQLSARTDVDPGFMARRDGETVGAGGARRIEQRIHHDVFVRQGGTGDPEIREARELFAGRGGGVNGQAARGGAKYLIFGAEPEIAGAEETGNAANLVSLVKWIKDVETGKTQIVRAFLLGIKRPEAEQRGVVVDVADALCVDLM